jgi:hypothetical protein
MRSPLRSPTLAKLLALSAVACGAQPTPPPASKQAAAFVDAAAPAADAGEPVESLDALAARGRVEAPLMREAQRIGDASKPYEMKLDRDTCVRAIFAASRPVSARIEDDTKVARGDVSPASTSSLVPPKGPACGRKGEVLKLVVDGAGDPVLARAVVWMAP